MKPILFRGDMVRAILAGRKTVTRRVVKSMCNADILDDTKFFVSPRSGAVYWDGIDRKLLMDGKPVISPYCIGDILYARETWTQDGGVYRYKAGFYDQNRKWRPSIHMPLAAARIFLRVTDVRVERVQDVTEDEARAEGCYTYRDFFNGVNSGSFYPTARDAFANLWDSTIKPADRALYGWAANPWVWVIAFERISREEAEL